MNEAQFTELMEVLRAALENMKGPYSLAEAQDWYMAVALVAVASGLLVYIWQNLRQEIRDMREWMKELILANRNEWKEAVSKEELERKEQINHIWTALNRCQERCHDSDPD